MTNGRRPLTCVSLFSGCGGLDLGLERAGFRVILANDLEPKCALSHVSNFAETKFFTGSITELTKELASSLTNGATDGEIDLLAGGPPCPPYSKSRFYRKELPRALDDPKGWESLNGYLRTLEWLHPRAFLMENVAGLAYKVHDDAFQLVLKAAARLGYTVSYRVLNAANFGVPQIRERLFIVGVRDGAFLWPEETHAAPDKIDLFSTSLNPWRTAGQAISKYDTEANSDDAGHFAGGQHHELLRQVPPGDNYLYFTEKRGHPNPRFLWRSRYWSFLLKLSPDIPSWTIQARRSNNMGPFHWRNRILRIEEVKALQTFPEDWFLSGTIEQQWRQVGNAVPPLLAELLGKQLSMCLQEVSSGQTKGNGLLDAGGKSSKVR
jgi:DNA (cytosine-5)-methyltransferase 1